MGHTPASALPQVRVERELSLRAVLTGAVLGILLTPSNVYAGLKIGWSFNMSIIALLVGFVLCSAALLSGLVKWIDGFVWAIPRWAPTPAFERMTFTLDPSLLLVGFGGIIGIRVGLTLLLGAALAWGGLAPWLVDHALVVLAPNASGQLRPGRPRPGGHQPDECQHGGWRGRAVHRPDERLQGWPGDRRHAAQAVAGAMHRSWGGIVLGNAAHTMISRLNPAE